MQDNASIYTAGVIRQQFADNNVQVIDWPPYSPDLNPIEHLWRHIKEKRYKLEAKRGKSKAIGMALLDELHKDLERAWHMVDNGTLDNLVGSMGRRVAAVIAAGGWHTKY